MTKLRAALRGLSPAIRVFLIATALMGLAWGMSDSILSNYFKEAYDVNAQQRGFIELPREFPGFLTAALIAALAFLGNLRGNALAQLLSAGAMVVLGLTTPSFPVMLVFLFLFSAGTHISMPLSDSVGLALPQGPDKGAWLGRFKGVQMGFTALAGVITFLGFRFGWFSFENPIAVFLLAAALFALVAVLMLYLFKLAPQAGKSGGKRLQIVLKRRYLRYYLICALFGGRKQIMLVYSPWVLIELLDFKADTMSVLAVVGSLIGIVFMPMVGRWADRFGVKRVMTAEALGFVAIYISYGFLSAGLYSGTVAVAGFGMALVYLLNVVDRMTAQFAMVRTLYMRQIAEVPEDITPSLSMGMSIDHAVAIAGSYICGSIWYNFGPQYVFLVAGVLSLLNLVVAQGIKPVNNEQLTVNN
jgi:hypothetical protein